MAPVAQWPAVSAPRVSGGRSASPKVVGGGGGTRGIRETRTLTYLGYKPRFSVPSCMVIVFLMAPLNSAGAERAAFAANARRRSARNGMLHAGRRREPDTTVGVIGPAVVAVRRSERRWETLWPLWITGGRHRDRPGLGAEPFRMCVARRFVLWHCVHAFYGFGDRG